MYSDPSTAAAYAERTIVHQPVPDRKQIVAIQKAPLYKEVLSRYGWWDDANDEPMRPFKTRGDGAITVRQADLDEVVQEGNQSSRSLYQMVADAQKVSKRRGDKVIESDGVGIALMLEDMSRENDAGIEAERRALIMSNFTRQGDQKVSPSPKASFAELSCR